MSSTCQCEHKDHFEKGASAHKYDRRRATHEVDTSFGTFAVCATCAFTHYGTFPSKELPPPRTLVTTVCRFKREQDSKPEYGLAVCKDAVDYDVLMILDMDGVPVTLTVWSYDLRPERGTLVFTEP